MRSCGQTRHLKLLGGTCQALAGLCGRRLAAACGHRPMCGHVRGSAVRACEAACGRALAFTCGPSFAGGHLRAVASRALVVSFGRGPRTSSLLWVPPGTCGHLRVETLAFGQLRAVLLGHVRAPPRTCGHLWAGTCHARAMPQQHTCRHPWAGAHRHVRALAGTCTPPGGGHHVPLPGTCSIQGTCEH